MHYYDPRDQGNFTFVKTVANNKLLFFTKRQIKGAEQARRLYKCLSHPSITDFKWVLCSNGIKNCPVSLKDAEIAEKVWGSNIGTLKGKTTRRAAGAVEMEDLIPIPPYLTEENKEIVLAINICFVNKIPFFVMLSRNLCFTTSTHLENRTLNTIFKAFKGIYKYYYDNGFRITTVMADSEFTALQTLFSTLVGSPNINLTAAMSTSHSSNAGSE